MKLSVVIPTRGDQNMQNSIECLQRQTFKDFEVIFIVDRIVTSDSAKDTSFGAGESRGTRGNIRFITHTNSDFRPQKNASYNRNFGIKAAKGEYIQLMDDDEWIEDDYLERSLALREEYREKLDKDFILTPTLMYRKTGHIQSQ